MAVQASLFYKRETRSTIGGGGRALWRSGVLRVCRSIDRCLQLMPDASFYSQLERPSLPVYLAHVMYYLRVARTPGVFTFL